MNLDAPLSEFIRPDSLDSVIGQGHLLNRKNGTIWNFVSLGYIPLMVLYGPPGVGKTTLARILAESTGYVFVELSATDLTVGELRELLGVIRAENRQRRILGDKRLRVAIFIDEIHRFSSTQQDFLLPFVENGDFVFLGATTVEPHKRIRRAILSRCQLFELSPLLPEETAAVVQKAVVFENIRRKLKHLEPVSYDQFAIDAVAKHASGDARTAINFVQLVSATNPGECCILQHNVAGKIRQLTKTQAGLVHQSSVPIMAEMFRRINHRGFSESCWPTAKKQLVEVDGTSVTIRLADAAAQNEDLRPEEPEKQRNIFRNGTPAEIQLSRLENRGDLSEDSDSEPGPLYDFEMPKSDFSNRLSRSNFYAHTAVALLLQLLASGELLLYILKQLILFSCVFVDGDTRQLPIFMSFKKILALAAADEKKVLADFVVKLAQLRKIRDPPITRQLLELLEYFENTQVERPLSTYELPDVEYDDELVGELLTEPLSPRKSPKPVPVADLSEFGVVNEGISGGEPPEQYTLGTDPDGLRFAFFSL